MVELHRAFHTLPLVPGCGDVLFFSPFFSCYSFLFFTYQEAEDYTFPFSFRQRSGGGLFILLFIDHQHHHALHTLRYPLKNPLSRSGFVLLYDLVCRGSFKDLVEGTDRMKERRRTPRLGYLLCTVLCIQELKGKAYGGRNCVQVKNHEDCMYIQIQCQLLSKVITQQPILCKCVLDGLLALALNAQLPSSLMMR